MLAFVGTWVRARIERAMEVHLAGNLQTILDANVEALREWAAAMRSLAEVLAADDSVRERVAGLVSHAQAKGTAPQVLLAAPGLETLNTHLRPALQARGFQSYFLIDRSLVIIASSAEPLIGINANSSDTLDACFAGNAVVTRPFLLEGPRDDLAGKVLSGQPLMFAAAPVRSRNREVLAVLGLSILPQTDFTRILRTASSGNCGETFAFDRQGLFLSESRFKDQLKQIGLVQDSPDARIILALEARDPLVDLTRGLTSPKRRSELPLTLGVREAIAGRPGMTVSGYRDYRGVPVAGAWTWLPDFDMGLVTKLDLKEAFAPLLPIRLAFWFLFGLLTLGSGVVFFLMRAANRAALKARQLGQYRLEEEIGKGGFGSVYRARHVLMRRPVAVKVLNPEAGANSIARFEREVQMTSRLSHPNTVAIYDYGHTPAGLFYYAMEYLEGLSLAALIAHYGPQPEGRIIYLLRQACASLAEAHAQGLVHRDIKPQNILLTRRGGIPDFVKVLDFGLVKAPENTGELELTGAQTTLGTPLYMSPEAVKSADSVQPASDIYALGAVGYELLTGGPIFPGTTLGEVFMQHLSSTPEKPSARLKRPVSPDLEDLLLRCLAKKPSERPTARQLEQALERCVSATAWNRETAEEWWQIHLASQTAKKPLV